MTCLVTNRRCLGSAQEILDFQSGDQSQKKKKKTTKHFFYCIIFFILLVVYFRLKSNDTRIGQSI